MIKDYEYLMEHEGESIRLDVKTDESAVERQALWAGIRPGMRVADICCGAGRTTAVLGRLVQPGGTVVGVDGSGERIGYASGKYMQDGVSFACHNIRGPLEEMGLFDFVWVRFVLEYYRTHAFEIVRNISGIVKPGGILCLIDLDHNCLSHYRLSERLQRTLSGIMSHLEERADFDPYAGRKLYSHLFNLGYREIDVDVAAHHLIFGDLRDNDSYNWMKKIEVISGKVGYPFSEYQGGYPEFVDEFSRFFAAPERFTYSPLIMCRGRKAT